MIAVVVEGRKENFTWLWVLENSKMPFQDGAIAQQLPSTTNATLLPTPLQEHIRQSKESKLDELGRHSTKWTEKQQIQIRDMECMSVKYPPPPLSPITRHDIISGDDPEEVNGSQTIIPGGDRYGFHDHIMHPPPMKMSGHHAAAIGLQQSAYHSKGSISNIPTKEFEVSDTTENFRSVTFIGWIWISKSE